MSSTSSLQTTSPAAVRARNRHRLANLTAVRTKTPAVDNENSNELTNKNKDIQENTGQKPRKAAKTMRAVIRADSVGFGGAQGGSVVPMIVKTARKAANHDEKKNGSHTEQEREDVPRKEQDLQMDFEAACKAVAALPRDKQLELVDRFAAKAEEKHQPETPVPTNRAEMKALKMETYPEFKKRTGSTDGKECLRQNWGQWLKAFTPELDRDYMSKADLGRLDPQLLARLRREYPKDELHEFLPSLPLLNDQIAATTEDKDYKEMTRLAAIVERRTQPG